jgi:hypothetical protein
MEDEHDGRESRSLQDPPRCKGGPLGDGKYAGCPYGNGEVTPLSGLVTAPYVTVLVLRVS